MNRRIALFSGCIAASSFLVACAIAASGKEARAERGDAPRESNLPLPTTEPRAVYEKKLYDFVRARRYATELGWARDKGVRDTGPWIDGTYYGTHPAVRIYYSPSVLYWMTGDPAHWPEGAADGRAPRKEPRAGAVPDGGMIVKEMFSAPAAQYAGKSEAELVALLESPSSQGWAVMVKDSAGSKDGWFWSAVFQGETLDGGDWPYRYPNSGFGQYCLNCHASAAAESTFASLRNVAGFPGDPITFFVDDSWRGKQAESMLAARAHPHSRAMRGAPDTKEPAEVNELFLATFRGMPPVGYDQVKKFPSESLDRVVAAPAGAGQFLSSDQCLGCHAGGSPADGPFGPVMVLMEGEDGERTLNVSPYGEWRWSPMGLAGRDPVFHAQLESELSLLAAEFPPEAARRLGEQTVNTCMLCHGAMGKRQLDIDRGVGAQYWKPEASFQLDWIYATDPADPHAKYGALARDGISCTLCHHIADAQLGIADFLVDQTTGRFSMGPPNRLAGPFGADPAKGDGLATRPMEHALGITPHYDPYVKSSRMCGSCHAINLPVVDYPLDHPPKTPCDVVPDPVLNRADPNPHFAGFLHEIEQATYLEWLNSAFQNEFEPWDSGAKSCQDCHMPTGYHALDGRTSVDPIRTKIAFVEDGSYPETDHRAPVQEITPAYREQGFARHTLQGLNVFLAEMFRQFDDVLGVRLTNYMTGTQDLDFAIENFVQNARSASAKLEIVRVERASGVLEADVQVTNLTGHRLPSGVGFRRLFLEFLVVQEEGPRESVVWASGRTNGVGVLLGPDGAILPSEFLAGGAHQRHWELIEREDQVQIYEELTKDAQGRFTTSFLHRACEVKDNRLLPRGWTKDGPSPSIPRAFVEATHPDPIAAADPRYSDGSGTDLVTYRVRLPEGADASNLSVRATLYSQSFAPYYLHQRFADVPPGPDGDARRRLYYLASHLDLVGTPIEDWKLALATVRAVAPK